MKPSLPLDTIVNLHIPRQLTGASLELGDGESKLAPEKYTHPTSSVSAANLRDWLLTIENVMMDRNKKVVLQDAVTLMDLDDPDCDYSQHHIFRGPVFKIPHFMEFRNEFQEAARNDMSPITETLAANAPAMHYELWSMNARLTVLDSKLETGLLRQLDQSTEHPSECDVQGNGGGCT
ncbi:hypothetical protein EDD21DRAFT_419523 [Dissophora ornata]|nr:hypothetical protein EDD21DRAFT_419523 [Dissophora ornata]